MKLLKSDIVFIFFIGLILFLGLRCEKKEEIPNRENEVKLFQTVGRIDKTYRRYFSYTYFYKNKIYYGSKENTELNSNSYLGKFYKVEVTIHEPAESSIDLEQEITDSIVISQAGFRKKKLNEILE